jgi:hypothetical protein
MLVPHPHPQTNKQTKKALPGGLIRYVEESMAWPMVPAFA